MNKKECAQLLRFIHQFIQENLQQIVRKRQDEKYTTPTLSPTKYYYPMATKISTNAIHHLREIFHHNLTKFQQEEDNNSDQEQDHLQ
jgi:hypothetical protein